MKRILAALLLLAGAGLANSSLHAQAVPSATARQFSLTAGGTFSLFQPDFVGGTSAQTNGQSLFYGIDGPAVFVDVRFRRWVQFEAEGRWMRFNVRSTSTVSGSLNVNAVPEDNYLVGPRIPFRVGRFTPYAKILGGYGVTNLLNVNQVAGNSLSGYMLAYGGGTDYRLTKHLSVRLIDFEYQQWFLTAPATSTSFTIQPYGASAGISYKIF
jgi:opacity protein-like surface antigen